MTAFIFLTKNKTLSETLVETDALFPLYTVNIDRNLVTIEPHLYPTKEYAASNNFFFSNSLQDRKDDFKTHFPHQTLFSCP